MIIGTKNIKIYILFINPYYFTLFSLPSLFYLYHSSSLIFGLVIISIGSFPDKFLLKNKEWR